MNEFGWRGPDFSGWWDGDWRSRVQASISAGVGNQHLRWHWTRIKTAYLSSQNRPPLEDFLGWLQATRGLAPFVRATGKLGDPELVGKEDALLRMFPDLAVVETSWRPMECRLVSLQRRIGHADPPLLALLPADSVRPLIEGTCSLSVFLEQLSRHRLCVRWDQPIFEIAWHVKEEYSCSLGGGF